MATSPTAVAEFLRTRVIGQEEAIRALSVALVKKLDRLSTGNVLMIGSSGTGKTTLMRAVEDYLSADPELSRRSTLIRLHAHILAEETERGRPGEAVLRRLLRRASEQAGPDATREELLERMRHGIVFLDEVDKIRASVGGVPNAAGIRAQESLLTLIENEAVPFALPEWAGGGTVTVPADGLLFVAAGAFEGLYDAVLDRVTVGADRGALQPVSVVDEGEVRQEMHFRLADWLRNADLYEYGMTPQFLSRFDAVVLLQDLGEDELVRIFLEIPDAGLAPAREYFDSRGVALAISPAAVRRIAREARKQSRIGARAMREVFRRVIRDYEFDPAATAENGALMIDAPEVEAALAEG